jgi:branched-chain amino acid transport system ATP-binding protein
VLETEGIETAYGQVKVLKGVSLRLDKGEAVTLIGSNGAGKTTLINTISGIIKPLKGKIVFEGQDITRTRPDQITRRGICQVPEGRMVFGNFTVLQNLKMGSYPIYRKIPKKEREKDFEFVFDLFPELRGRLGDKAGRLSGGQQQMLAIGVALMSRPKALLLDEPSLGLAPLFVNHLFDTLKTLKGMGLTLLLVEQNANLALAFADRGYVLEVGKMVLSDSCKALRESARVQEYYLGMVREGKGGDD